jgi:hypothetical protein
MATYSMAVATALIENATSTPGNTFIAAVFRS